MELYLEWNAAVISVTYVFICYNLQKSTGNISDSLALLAIGFSVILKDCDDLRIT